MSQLNALAEKYDANCIIHSGNFGFFDASSVSRISVKILKQIAVFSPLIDPNTLAHDPEEIKRQLPASALSELPAYLSGANHLNVPVYTIYGAAEDLSVIEKFRSGEYSVPNLHLIDETSTHAIPTPSGHVIRLFGLGGSLVLHRLFDNGDGVSTIAGSPGVMWTTVLQMGQLLATARKFFDPAEIRVFVSHAAPAKEGLLAQLALSLRADFTVSSGLHFIYGSSFNEFSVLPSLDHYKGILAASRAQFMQVWSAVKTQLLELVEADPKQKQLLLTAIDTFESMPTSTETDASSAAETYMATAHRNMWHFNLCDAAFGALVLNIVDGRVATESYSEGFNFQYRRPPPTSAPTGPAAIQAPSAPAAAQAPPPVSAPTAPAAPPPEQPGIWIANAAAGSDAVKLFFAEPDRALIQSIVIKENYVNPDKQFALVYFETAEQVAVAIDRLDKDAAGKVSVIRSHDSSGHGGSGSGASHRRSSWGPATRGGSTGGRAGFGKGGPRGGGGPPFRGGRGSGGARMAA